MTKIPAQKIDHIMVASRDLEASRSLYAELLGTEFYDLDPYGLEDFGVSRAALSAPGVELLEAKPGGRLSAFIDHAGEDALGIAFKVPDLNAAIEVATSRGLRLIGKTEGPRRRAAAFDPADSHGVMIKFVEYIQTYEIGNFNFLNDWREQRGLPLATMDGPIRGIGAEKVDHVIIFVEDLQRARSFFDSLFVTHFPDPLNSPVRPARMSVDGLGIELIGAMGDEATRFFEARRTKDSNGDGIFATSLKVRDFGLALERLRAAGARPAGSGDLGGPPRDNTRRDLTRKVALFGRGGKVGIGVELIQWIPLVHPIIALDMGRNLRHGG